MSTQWKIVERNIGRAGGIKKRKARQLQWDMQYGPDQWEVGYEVDGKFLQQTEALETVYYQSYVAHFEQHPEDLDELIKTAKTLRNPHAEATTGVDLQVPAVLDYLKRHDLTLQGNDVVDIGSWGGQRSHAISIRLSPLTIRCVLDPDFTLEGWWQDKKCLAVIESNA